MFGDDGWTFERVNIDLARLPATMAVADHVPVPLDDEFTFGLELLISGLQRRVGQG